MNKIVNLFQQWLIRGTEMQTDMKPKCASGSLLKAGRLDSETGFRKKVKSGDNTIH